MGLPRAVLGPGEELLVHSHPHWRALVRPALLTCVGAGLAGVAGGFVEKQVHEVSEQHVAWAVLAVVYALLVLRFALLPAVRWLRTELVVTDSRVVYRPAGSRRYGVDVPLRRVSAVRFRHTLADRALGTGSLILECGYLPPVEIADVPGIAEVHAAVYTELTRLPPAFDAGRENMGR